MTQKRKMPTKKKIFEHWENIILNSDELDSDTCWGCGFPANLERCHIHARCESFNDDLSNLVLLCKDCHRMQESMCNTKEGRNDFVKKIKEYPLFMDFKINSMLMKVKYGIYDEILNTLGYNKKTINKFKNELSIKI